MPIAGLVGAVLGANAAGMVQKKLDEIVATPGVDVSKAYGTAIDSFNQNAAGAEGIASRTNAFNQGEMTKMLEAGIPGYSGLQAQRTKTAADWMSGDLPQDVTDAVNRSSVAKSYEGGYQGSPAGRNLVARDLGLTSLDLMGKGQALTSEILKSTPMAKLVGTNDILNMSGKDIVGLLSSERTQKMAAMRDRAIAPGATAVWAQHMNKQEDQFNSLVGSVAGTAAGAAM